MKEFAGKLVRGAFGAPLVEVDGFGDVYPEELFVDTEDGSEVVLSSESAAEHAERLAEVARLKGELDAAWEATGVAGAVRGLTTLADVVDTHRRELIEVKSELDEPRSLPRDAMKLLRSMASELLRRREQVSELQAASGELLERARTAERKHAKAVAVIKGLAQLRGHIDGLREMYDFSRRELVERASAAARWAARRHRSQQSSEERVDEDPDDPWCATCGHLESDHPRGGPCGAACEDRCECPRFEARDNGKEQAR